MTQPLTDKHPKVEFDAHSPEYAEDIETAHEQMRRSGCPIAWTESYDGFWAVSSYTGLTSALRPKGRVSAAKTFDAEGNPVGGQSIPPPPTPATVPNEYESPEWEGYRNVLNPHFSPAAIRRRRERVDAITAEVLNQVIETGEIDLVMDLANPVTALVTLDVLGLPFNTWRFYGEPIHRLTYEALHPEVTAGIAGIFGRLFEIIAERRESPQTGLIDDMIAVDMNGRKLRDDELQSMFWLMLLGGFDTTAALTTNALLWFDEHPEQKQRVLADDKLMATATEEFVRWVSPVISLARTAMEDYECEGAQIKEGDRMWMIFHSANRDDSVFSEPDEVKLDRFPNPHLGFGAGIHRCLGSHLARLIFQSMLRQVFTRMPDLTIDRERTRTIPDRAHTNAHIVMPATFTPGQRVETGITID